MPIYVTTFLQLVIRGDLKTEHRRVYMHGNCHVSWMLQKLLTSLLGVVVDGLLKNIVFWPNTIQLAFFLCQSKFPPVGTSIFQLCYLFFVSLIRSSREYSQLTAPLMFISESSPWYQMSIYCTIFGTIFAMNKYIGYCIVTNNNEAPPIPVTNEHGGYQR